VGHVVRLGEVRSAYKVSIGHSEGETPLGRSRHR
jgi:hypothetical protein